MDTYNLINSKAISNHCRAISHQFNPLEMAYLVYANNTLNIIQKHALFLEIIQGQPDMEIPGRPWTPAFESLHDFLRQFMDLQNKYRAMFYQDELDSFYSFEIRYPGESEPHGGRQAVSYV